MNIQGFEISIYQIFFKFLYKKILCRKLCNAIFFIYFFKYLIERLLNTKDQEFMKEIKNKKLNAFNHYFLKY